MMDSGFENDAYVRELRYEGDGVPLVYLHGLGDSGLFFCPMHEQLGPTSLLRRYRHIIPDLPGYGRSIPSAVPLTLNRTAKWVAKWLLDRGESSVILIGHSMGGVVSLLIAEAFPHIVKGIIDIEGNKTPSDCTISRLASNTSLSDFLHSGFVEMQHRLLDEAVAGSGCLGQGDHANMQYQQSLRICDPSAFYAHANDLVELSSRNALAARLGVLSCPKVYIHGSPWGAGPDSLNEVDKNNVPRLCVHKAGHWLCTDQPVAFMSQLERAIEMIESSTYDAK